MLIVLLGLPLHRAAPSPLHSARSCFRKDLNPNAPYPSSRTSPRHPQCHGLPAGDGKAAERTCRSPAARPEYVVPGERELIATYVSYLNDCYYCQTIHGAIAAASLNDDEHLVARVKSDFQHADISDKLKALLVIAGKVQKGGKHVTADDVANARAMGASDLEIHDTVLIAAAFCMYNRYVDGLATQQPRDEAMYRERGKQVAQLGYVTVSQQYLSKAGAPLKDSEAKETEYAAHPTA
jgi:AhpD family alkylhydroperoxidase